MYKIMFVDDDPLILRRLHQILDWGTLDFEILPDAYDGISALALLKSAVPDIIICDINMPNMDGLELTAILKEHYPDVHCILLTVNDSFGCAQQALNIGVSHYLLKPIEPEPLKELILKILSQLDSSRKKENYISALYSKALLSERMIRDKFLNWLVSGRQNLDERQLKEKFEFYQIPLRGEEFQIIAVHIDSMDFPVSLGKHMDDLMQTAIKSIEDTLSDYSNCVVFTDSFYQCNILMGYEQDSGRPGPGIELVCRLLRDNLLFDLNLSAAVFYSCRYKGLSNIYRCYYETKFLSRYNLSVLNKGILSFEEYMKNAFDMEMDLDSIRSATFRLLRLDDGNGLAAHVRATLELPFARHSFDTFNMLRIDFVMTGLMFLRENKLALQDIFDRHYTPLSDVMELNEPEGCAAFLEQYFHRILEHIRGSKVSSSRRITEKCMELIEQNLSSPELSVKWLSSQLYMNENYLSRMFRREMNLPLVKYMMQKKMEAAKKYLDEGYTNLQEVARLTGFADPLYFSKCFKKEYGVAPSKYIGV